VIIGYLEDGPDLILLAMDSWDEGRPSWWLNLAAHPDSVVRLTDQLPSPDARRPAAGRERESAVAALGGGRSTARRVSEPAVYRDACDHPGTARCDRLTCPEASRLVPVHRWRVAMRSNVIKWDGNREPGG